MNPRTTFRILLLVPIAIAVILNVLLFALFGYSFAPAFFFTLGLIVAFFLSRWIPTERKPPRCPQCGARL